MSDYKKLYNSSVIQTAMKIDPLIISPVQNRPYGADSRIPPALASYLGVDRENGPYAPRELLGESSALIDLRPVTRYQPKWKFANSAFLFDKKLKI